MIPLHIVFRHFSLEEQSEAENFINKMAASLAGFKDYVMGCKVLCDAPRRHQKYGDRYRIRVMLFLPGKMIVAGNDEAKAFAQDYPGDAVSNAFKAANDKLRSFVDKKKRTRSYWRRLHGETIPLFSGNRG